MLVIEDIIGRCAPLLGVEPDVVRRRNFYVEGQTTPYGQPVRHPERMVLAWDQVRDSSAYDDRRREIERFNEEHPHTKRGLAITPVKFGISFNFTSFNQAGALVHVYKDGSVLINHGGTEMGQGLHTKMLQVAATALGVPLAKVRLAPTRTDKVPNTSATAASAGADLNGGAVKNACDQILGRLTQVRAENPDASWDELVAHRLPRAHPAVGGRLLQDRGAELGRHHHDRLAVQVLRLRRGRLGGRGRRLHRRLRPAPRRHRARRRRQPLAAGRPRPGRGRVRAGRGLADAGGPALGHLRRPDAWAAQHPVGVDVQAAELLGDAHGVQRRAAGPRPRGRRGLRLEGRRRTAADAGVLRARGAAPGVRGVRAAGRLRRARLARDAGGGLLGARPRPVAESGYDHVVAGGGRPPRRTARPASWSR